MLTQPWTPSDRLNDRCRTIGTTHLFFSHKNFTTHHCVHCRPVVKEPDSDWKLWCFWRLSRKHKHAHQSGLWWTEFLLRWGNIMVLYLTCALAFVALIGLAFLARLWHNNAKNDATTRGRKSEIWIHVRRKETETETSAQNELNVLLPFHESRECNKWMYEDHKERFNPQWLYVFFYWLLLSPTLGDRFFGFILSPWYPLNYPISANWNPWKGIT